jgi:hypothetical protein
LYDRFAFFLPDRIYQNLCEEAAGTDYRFREQQFVEAAKTYRSILMNYMQSKNGFGYAFFTQMPESEMLDTYNDYTQETIDKYCKEENLKKIEVDMFVCYRHVAVCVSHDVNSQNFDNTYKIK